MRRVLWVLGLLFVGCQAPPASLAPLASESDRCLDQRIVGQWQLVSARPRPERGRIISFGSLEDIVATITPDGASQYSLVLRKKDKTARLTLTLCEIGDSLYVSLQHPPIDDAALAGTTLRPYFLAKCTIADGRIRLSACKAHLFAQTLRDSKLPLVELDSTVVFTGTTEQLRQFVRDHDAELFSPGKDDLILQSAATK